MEVLGEARAGIEAGATSLMVIELERRVQHTQMFLRMASIELCRIAERAPDLAVELRHIAQKLKAEAEDLARRDIEDGRAETEPGRKAVS